MQLSVPNLINLDLISETTFSHNALKYSNSSDYSFLSVTELVKFYKFPLSAWINASNS